MNEFRNITLEKLYSCLEKLLKLNQDKALYLFPQNNFYQEDYENFSNITGSKVLYKKSRVKDFLSFIFSINYDLSRIELSRSKRTLYESFFMSSYGSLIFFFSEYGFLPNSLEKLEKQCEYIEFYILNSDNAYFRTNSEDVKSIFSEAIARPLYYKFDKEELEYFDEHEFFKILFYIYENSPFNFNNKNLKNIDNELYQLYTIKLENEFLEYTRLKIICHDLSMYEEIQYEQICAIKLYEERFDGIQWGLSFLINNRDREKLNEHEAVDLLKMKGVIYPLVEKLEVEMLNEEKRSKKNFYKTLVFIIIISFSLSSFHSYMKKRRKLRKNIERKEFIKKRLKEVEENYYPSENLDYESIDQLLIKKDK